MQPYNIHDLKGELPEDINYPAEKQALDLFKDPFIVEELKRWRNKKYYGRIEIANDIKTLFMTCEFQGGAITNFKLSKKMETEQKNIIVDTMNVLNKNVSVSKKKHENK